MAAVVVVAAWMYHRRPYQHHHQYHHHHHHHRRRRRRRFQLLNHQLFIEWEVVLVVATVAPAVAAAVINVDLMHESMQQI